jgi:adenylate cyclase
MVGTPAFRHYNMTVSSRRYPGTSVDMIKKHIDAMYEKMVHIINTEDMSDRLPGSMIIAFDAWTSV